MPGEITTQPVPAHPLLVRSGAGRSPVPLPRVVQDEQKQWKSASETLLPKWLERWAEIKKAWGIIGTDVDTKFQRFIVSVNYAPTAIEVADFVNRQLSEANLNFAILRSIGELKSLVALGFKSVPKRNRSALA